MIRLFAPFVPEKAIEAVAEVLRTPWLGQGYKVQEFEEQLSFLGENVLTVNSGTSALELAYDLLDLKQGDEVIVPVFTAVATSLPLVRRGVRVVFADVTDKMLMDWDDALLKITDKTRAIVNVHLFGLYNKAPACPVPIIGDACQYLDKTEGELFTAYSFQATKIITTGDGGALVCRDRGDYERAKLLRWYGIDRETGIDNVLVDIKEAGYKYHMNDVTAALGLAALPLLSKQKAHRLEVQKVYNEVFPSGGSPFLIHVWDREAIIKRLAARGVEAGMVHRRNDIYSVFGGVRRALPKMNWLESHYMFLPCHNSLSIYHAKFISSLITHDDLL